MKYLAVDLGNVVFEVSFENFKKKLSKMLNVSAEEAQYFLIRTQQPHDCGLTSISDELKDRFKINSQYIIDELISEWNKTIYPNSLVIRTLDLLTTKGVQIALLSNIGFEHARLIPHFLGQKLFERSIKFFSCEVGARKPSYLYYKTFLDMYPEFKGCVYLDDRLENIEVGKKLGLNGIHFDLDSHRNKNSLGTELDKIKKLIF